MLTQVKPISIAQYAAELKKRGRQTVPGGTETFWVRYLSGAMKRVPNFYSAPPAPGEVQHILWRSPAAVASYILEPSQEHPANAWLYTCTNTQYAPDKLPAVTRRNLRRGLKELVIRSISFEQVLHSGYQACRDTLRRTNLPEMTVEVYRSEASVLGKCPGHVFLGAWKDDTLAAFLSVWEVDDWVEIEGCWSMDSLLHLRPNDAVIHAALDYYLTEGRCRIVSYGLSSIQADSSREGLHRFKTKLGFESRPIHRVFTLHPLLRPFVNRVLLWGLDAGLGFLPRSRRLKKMKGILASMLRPNRASMNDGRYNSESLP